MRGGRGGTDRDAEEAKTGRPPFSEGMAPEDCGAAFVLGAAWMALAGLEAGPGGVESFTAGAVTIRQGDGAARRRALRMQAKQVMKPWLKDECFLFRGVRG